MANILKGGPVAEDILRQISEKKEELDKYGIFPTLAVLRIGERGDDIAYEKGVLKFMEKAGIEVKKTILPENASQTDILSEIEKINADETIHGCLMFRPLTDKETEKKACELLNPEKDVDSMTEGSLAGVFTGSKIGFPPCTAQACIEILKYYGYDIKGKKVTVVGRSLVIGKPVAMMLLSEDATVSICHSKSKDIAAICRDADIIVACVGKAGFVDETFVSLGQIILDVGINVNDNGKLCGDVAYDKVEPIVSAITPVPAGVGSVTTAVLASHVIDAAIKNCQSVRRANYEKIKH